MQVTAKQSGTKYGMLVIWEGATRGSVHNPIASYLVLLLCCLCCCAASLGRAFSP
jgi:hypothetical protein